MSVCESVSEFVEYWGAYAPKNEVHHDEANGKSFETVISIFIFLKLCHRDFSLQSNVKNHDFIKKLVQFSIFLEHPLVYLIQYNQSNIQDWTNKKRPMHFGASLSSGEVLEWNVFMTNPWEGCTSWCFPPICGRLATTLVDCYFHHYCQSQLSPNLT